MAFFKANKVIDRLNKMIDNAIEARSLLKMDLMKASCLRWKLNYHS
ncbi:histidine kinase OS=Lysinibacillus sphaericus OX=1421 GN=LS41612_11875 PE=4 SV=1 [Lysinibacillus sphaericus]